MYGLIWRKLPGGVPGKIAGLVVLWIAMVAVLFLVVFPWASSRLPFEHVTLDPPAKSHAVQVPRVLPGTAALRIRGGEPPKRT